MRLIFTVLVISTLYAQQIETRDGTRIKSNFLELKNNHLYLKDTTLNEEMVKRIMFIKNTQEQQTTMHTWNLKKILAAKDSALAKFPHEKGITILDNGMLQLNTDGTRSFTYHFIGIINSPERKDMATLRLYFDPELEKTYVISARTIKKNGTVINFSPKDIKISKPREGMVFFDKGYTMTINIPSAEVGDVVEYIYKDYVFSPWNKRILTAYWSFTGKDPVWMSSYTVKLPDTTHFHYKLLRMDTITIDTSYTISHHVKTYKFSTYKLAGYTEEPIMPSPGDFLPVMAGSNQPDWTYIFKWYSDFQKSRMTVTNSIKYLADSIVSGASDIDDSIANIYYFVQQNIRYISIKGAAASGVSGHPAQQTLENGYGDCTDKAILFATMLKAEGIEAYPVYLRTNDGPSLIKEIPSYYGNHAINQIFYPDKRYRFLDATGVFNRYPSFSAWDHGVYAINAIKRGIYFIDVPKPAENLRKYTYKMQLDSMGTLFVKFYSSYTGDYESGIRYYWNYWKKEDRIRIAQNMTAKIYPGATMDSFNLINLKDISKPFHLILYYHIPDYLKKYGKYYLLNFPEIKDRYDFPEIALSKRRYSLVYHTSSEIKDSIILTVPYNFSLLPQGDSISDSTPKSYYKGTLRLDKNRIIFKDVFKRYGRKIPVSMYENYRDEILKIKKFVSTPIVFEHREVR